MVLGLCIIRTEYKELRNIIKREVNEAILFSWQTRFAGHVLVIRLKLLGLHTDMKISDRFKKGQS